MGFMDKLKETAQNATNQAKNAYDSAKAANEQKKAEKAAYEQEMREKASAMSKERSETILNNFSGTSFFDGVDMKELFDFTNEYYCKLVLPAGSLENTCIDMYHYIDQRVEKKIQKTFPEHQEEDTVLIYLRAKKKTEVF